MTPKPQLSIHLSAQGTDSKGICFDYWQSQARAVKYRILVSIFIALMLTCQSLMADQHLLGASADEVYRRAKNGRWFTEAEKISHEILPTSDGKSFFALWKAGNREPARWIVSLHGSNGFATDDLALWYPHVKNRDVGVISLQWWIGTDDSTRSYYAPMQIYREIDVFLRNRGVKPGMVMLHGFSRGSANSYAVAALDAARGKKYFSLAIASSGGVGIDYPPNRAIVNGVFGHQPLQGTRWVTVAGARDANPERDGISGMRKAAAWLREQGAVIIDSIEDSSEGHGALMRNPKNAQRVLDMFLTMDKR